MTEHMQLSWFYCPVCGDREDMGGKCGCGLFWNERRRELSRHYLVLLTSQEAEVLRHKLARRLTRKLVDLTSRAS